MSDPTIHEMREFLRTHLSDEGNTSDIEEAIYWYAHDHHGGQSTSLYEALCASPFKPGPLTTGLEDDSIALDLYSELVEEFS